MKTETGCVRHAAGRDPHRTQQATRRQPEEVSAMPMAPPKHQRPASGKRHTFAVENRQATRALNTGSKAWRILRRQILVRDLYRCADCGRFGDQVDHADGDATNNEPATLQTLCASCHGKKTAAEQREKHGRA